MKKNPARRLGLREKEIKFGTFEYYFTLIVGPRGGVEPYMRWRYQDSDPDTDLAPRAVRACVFTKPGRAPVMWLPKPPRSAEDIGTMAHEAMHVVKDLMDWAHIGLGDESEEAYCHALGFVVRSVLEELRK